MPISSLIREELVAMLNRASQQVQALGGYPLALQPVCRELCVEIVRTDKMKGHAEVRRKQGVFEVRIGNTWRGEEIRHEMARYLVAHELGHVLLEVRGGVAATSKSEYWQLEDLCDDFARAILVPDSAVELVIAKYPSTVALALTGVQDLATEAQVPWAVAAHRVSQFLKNEIVFLTLQFQSAAQKLEVVSTSLPRKKEIGRRLLKTDSLSRVLSQLSAQGDQLRLDAEVLSNTECHSLHAFDSGSAWLTPSGMCRVAVWRASVDRSISSRLVSDRNQLTEADQAELRFA